MRKIKKSATVEQSAACVHGHTPLGYEQIYQCNTCDYCKVCDKVTVWQNEFCRRCKTPWGYDSRADWAEAESATLEAYATTVHRLRVTSQGDGWVLDAWNTDTGQYAESAWDFDTREEAFHAIPCYVQNLRVAWHAKTEWRVTT